ncbi:hypothetical protein Tco_1126742 [Tanacetum coccineum]
MSLWNRLLHFIANHGLFDIPLGGLMDSSPDFKVTALPRGCIVKAYSECSQAKEVSRMYEVRFRFNDIDEKIDSGIALKEEKQDRLSLIKECDDIQKLVEMDTAQKARVKWDIEGDENLKFFHGFEAKKTSTYVKGIMANRHWGHQSSTC